MLIDLHTHSTASDGIYTPSVLLEQAHLAHITTMALTDHDTTEGVAEAKHAATAFDIEVIAGCELNTTFPGTSKEAHILGYFVPWHDEAFQQQLQERRVARLARGQKMVAQLQSAGVAITWEHVLQHAHGAVGRPHVAAALVDLGLVSSVSEAFDRYLSPGMVGYVAREPFTPTDALTLLRSAGAVVSWAHPARTPDLETILPTFVDAGLQGLETYYGEYDEETVQYLLQLCDRFHLIPTGGSDFHGPGLHPTPLGGHPVPESSLDALRSIARWR